MNMRVTTSSSILLYLAMSRRSVRMMIIVTMPAMQHVLFHFIRREGYNNHILLMNSVNYNYSSLFVVGCIEDWLNWQGAISVDLQCTDLNLSRSYLTETLRYEVGWNLAVRRHKYRYCPIFFASIQQFLSNFQNTSDTFSRHVWSRVPETLYPLN